MVDEEDVDDMEEMTLDNDDIAEEDDKIINEDN